MWQIFPCQFLYYYSTILSVFDYDFRGKKMYFYRYFNKTIFLFFHFFKKNFKCEITVRLSVVHIRDLKRLGNL